MEELLLLLPVMEEASELIEPVTLSRAPVSGRVPYWSAPVAASRPRPNRSTLASPPCCFIPKCQFGNAKEALTSLYLRGGWQRSCGMSRQSARGRTRTCQGLSLRAAGGTLAVPRGSYRSYRTG